MQTNCVIWIIIGAGVFGGLINYFRNVFDKRIVPVEIIRPVLLGLAASALVPLFLNMISSDLLKSTTNIDTNYFLFLGFCLIASMFSGEFIDSIGKRVLNQIKEVKRELEETNTENDTGSIEEAYDVLSLSPNQKMVLDTFIKSRYTYRSISGIAKETSLEKSATKAELMYLQSKGLVEVVQRKKGPRWKITSDGYKNN